MYGKAEYSSVLGWQERGGFYSRADFDAATSFCKPFRQVLLLCFVNEASQSQSGTTQERSSSEQGLGPACNSCCVMSLCATADAIGYMKEEYVVFVKVNDNCIGHIFTAKEAYKLLKWGTHSGHLVYHVLFQRQLESMEQSIEDIFESTGLNLRPAL